MDILPQRVYSLQATFPGYLVSRLVPLDLFNKISVGGFGKPTEKDCNDNVTPLAKQ